jgi:hypothetical protein
MTKKRKMIADAKQKAANDKKENVDGKGFEASENRRPGGLSTVIQPIWRTNGWAALVASRFVFLQKAVSFSALPGTAHCW